MNPAERQTAYPLNLSRLHIPYSHRRRKGIASIQARKVFRPRANEPVLDKSIKKVRRHDRSLRMSCYENDVRVKEVRNPLRIGKESAVEPVQQVNQMSVKMIWL